MQRKADAAIIDKSKSINRNWCEVKIWGKSVTGRLAHEDRPHPFSVTNNVKNEVIYVNVVAKMDFSLHS
jgi:hypothetical protein